MQYAQSAFIQLRNGRLTLDLDWYKPSGDTWVFSGPDAIAGGRYEIKRTVTTQQTSSDDFPFNREIDIHDEYASGLIFTTVRSSTIGHEGITSVPLFIGNG